MVGTGLRGGTPIPHYALCVTHLLVFPALMMAGWIFMGSASAAPGAAAPAHPLGPSPAPTQGCGVAWKVVDSPDLGAGNSGLYAVDAVSAQDVWAVGYFTTTGYVYQTLIEHFDGSQWSVVPGTGGGSLYGVATISAGDVWAVGYIGTFPGPYQTLAAHWNGSQWSVVPSPNPGLGGQLHGVAAVSPTDVWAVGQYQTLTSTQTLVERWNGQEWSVVPSPNVGANSELSGIAALSANDIWAVGAYPNISRQYVPLVERWNGQEWSVVSSPNILGYLYSVEAVSSTEAWAVGYTSNGGLFQTLILHWDGTQWGQSASPSPSTTFNSLYSVSAAPGGDVWAVGTGGGTLAVRWDGERWTRVPSPNVQGGGSFGGGVAVSGSDVWAVGDYYDNSAYRTLIERYHDPCAGATPTATPSRSPTRTVTPRQTSTRTPASTATATPCAFSFTDVATTDYFYEPVRYLYCHGAVSGYEDNTFRPYNNTTRGQLCKIVVLAENFAIDTTGGPHFNDVPATNPFYGYVETAFNRGIISGYADNTFRWGNDVTRGQLCKITALAEGWAINTSGGPHFVDVPVDQAFYGYVETAFNRGIISGYADNTFRPGNPATRGQIGKIVYNAITLPGPVPTSQIPVPQR
jgi:hypothetical protein